MKKVLFFNKYRELEDRAVWAIAHKYRRVFLGYPVLHYTEYLEGLSESTVGDWQPNGLSSIYIDISTDGWKKLATEDFDNSYRREVQHNIQLINEIGTGSIALVPKFNQGICYAGEVVSPFELADKPQWAAEYVKLLPRTLSARQKVIALGNVIQSWRVRKWATIPLLAIPGWISCQMQLSRQYTRGIIDDSYAWERDRHGTRILVPRISAINLIRKLMRPGTANRHPLLTDSTDLEHKLYDLINPMAFPSLMIDLLQLDAKPGVYWRLCNAHTEFGDTDGIAVDKPGNLLSVLHCSEIESDPEARAEWIRLMTDATVEIVIAALRSRSGRKKMPSKSRFLDAKDIAGLIKQYAQRLPFAKSTGLVS